MRPRLLLALFSLAAPSRGDRSSGCQQVANPDEKAELPASFEFEGRQVLISFPPKYRSSKPSPLIVAYHDKDMTPAEMVKLTKFDQPELNRNAIAVFPSGRNVTTGPKFIRPVDAETEHMDDGSRERIRAARIQL
jgi:poly(3-hydroxybutyrate) depolymerase